jgi:hypothetical protein
MKHYLYITTSKALTEGNAPLKFLDSFPSYSAASDYLKSDPGLLKSLNSSHELSDNEHPIFLILPEKCIVLAKPGKQDHLALTKLSNLPPPEPSATLQ